MMLTLGQINYLNCEPFFHFLTDSGFAGNIVSGVPSQLNRLLAQGAIDVSPSSSFEYARNWQDYLLLPGLSISSVGPVQSVLLFSGRTLEELENAEIFLTGESATSVNLLKVLLREYLHFDKVVCRVPEQPVEEIIAGGGSALLIGDRALRASLASPPGTHIYDLGELWLRFTGLPFVFALWILRREAASAKRGEVVQLLRQLAASRERACASLEELAAAVPEVEWMGSQRLVDYWRCMSYDLGGAHLEGLRLFFGLCRKHGLLESEPEVKFFE
ncbi:chorismate dehydratase [Desulfuromonas versatilis]|uniref:Chorismate dehydratase n=1 Tax=Desulfuromonas versatilis TaxID=2802975 RepID=A0ABN6DX45_9BACT|nr:menaquinone biosynthesis protein [Desulfuromonas versatilis]BCR04693.1 chorismate dehydratase [Desulfuromonas versatilis]